MTVLNPTARRLARYTHVVSIVGDILAVRASDVGLGDLAVVDNWDGERSISESPANTACMQSLGRDT